MSFSSSYYGQKETARILQDNNADPKIKVTSGGFKGESACTYNDRVGNILKNCS